MDFNFSEQHTLLMDAARALLDDTCPLERLRALMDQGEAIDPARWQALAENGLTAVMLPESAGGLGLDAQDFVQIAQHCGYVGLPEPLLEHAGVAAPLLAACNPVHPLLEQAAAGQGRLAIGHRVNPFVAHADTATALLLAHQNEVHLVSPGQVKLTAQSSIDPFRRLSRVDWTPDPSTCISADAQTHWDCALDRGALFTAAQSLGLAQRCIDLAVAYARERKQFGKPIGSYQAVKHHLASAQVKIEFARPVVYAAAAQCERHDIYSRARISHAKLAAAEAADFAARQALQIHGAMGYSWEVDVHVFLKRALALQFAWGTPEFHYQRIHARVTGAPLGADQTFASEVMS